MNKTQLSHDFFDAELVIGLVSPVGAETTLVKQMLTESLNQAGYEVKVVKISADVIPCLVDVEPFGTDKFSRYRNLMNAGNACRHKTSDTAILAKGAAFIISRMRPEVDTTSKANFDQSAQSLSKTAFIIDSLKRPEEVNALRIIYSSGFVLIGIHEESQRRIAHLCAGDAMTTENAEKLVEADRDESALDGGQAVVNGQRVNETFHLADCFVELVGSSDRLRCDVRRIVDLCFGNPFITPTFDELAMFQAFASALRSADLSRQVGAVIANNDQVLATGANECPAAGGGLYWPERSKTTGCIQDAPSGRDFTRRFGSYDGCDSNRIEQIAIIQALAKRINDKVPSISVEELVSILDAEEIQSLTEFGRVVHAEMDALLSCARQGISTRGAVLYSTTFPCHNCAKHIIAAGIKRVVYVEPYSKSKALDFHAESILTPAQAVADNEVGVRFEPFVGIGPRRFFELFSMKLGSSYDLKRKDKKSGAKTPWTLSRSRLRVQMKPVSYLHFEMLAATEFGRSVPTFSQEMDQ